MPKKDLNKIKEEYGALATKLNELDDEELSKIFGGSHMADDARTYSDDTYDQLGVKYDPNHGQQGNYHPLIFFALSSCSKSDTRCCNCASVDSGPFCWYCPKRSEEVDSLR